MCPGAIWVFRGNDEAEASADLEGRCTGNIIQENYVSGAERGVDMKETDGNDMIGNTFLDTDGNEWEDNDDLLWKVSQDRVER